MAIEEEEEEEEESDVEHEEEAHASELEDNSEGDVPDVVPQPKPRSQRKAGPKAVAKKQTKAEPVIKVEKKNQPADKEGKGHYIVAEKCVTWGPIKFNWVETKIARGPHAGGISTSWQCVCPFHRDAADPSGTLCQRTRQFKTPAEQAAVMLSLKSWAIAGRECLSRAVGATPHKDVDMRAYPHKSDAMLDDEMTEALSPGVNWLDPAYGAGDGSDAPEDAPEDGSDAPEEAPDSSSSSSSSSSDSD